MKENKEFILNSLKEKEKSSTELSSIKEKTIKIMLPEIHITPEQIQAKNKRIISQDYEKDGILAKMIVFIYLNQPVSVSDLTDYLNQYYFSELDRSAISRGMKKLSDLQIISRASISYVLSLNIHEQKEIHKKCVEKFHNFLQTIPIQFRSRFNDINYMWTKSGDENKYVEWSCNLLKIPYE